MLQASHNANIQHNINFVKKKQILWKKNTSLHLELTKKFKQQRILILRHLWPKNNPIDFMEIRNKWSCSKIMLTTKENNFRCEHSANLKIHIQGTIFSQI